MEKGKSDLKPILLLLNIDLISYSIYDRQLKKKGDINKMNTMKHCIYK